MANPLTPNQLITAFKKWGVPYREYSGWKTRGRPGGFAPIGFIIHHTGGAFTESASYLKFLFETGRPAEGIPGPLCNFSGGPTGTVHIGSVGRTNNAGAGDWTTRQLVGAESYSGYSSEIKPGADDYSGGNGLYYGLEINYPGTAPMKDAQWNSAVRLGAALMDAHGWTALSCIGHREHSRRKWDPGNTLLYNYRKDVRALLKGEDMPLSPEDLASIKSIVRTVVTTELARTPIIAGPPKTAISTRDGGRYSYLAARYAKAALEAIAEIPGVNTDELAAKVAEAVERFDAEAVASLLEVSVKEDEDVV